MSPPEGTTGVPVNTRVVVELSEPVDSLSLDALRLEGSASGEVAGTAQPSTDSRTVTFTPAVNLPLDTFTLDLGGVSDVAGNALSFTSTFATVGVENLALEPGVTATASSQFSAGFPPDLVIDGDLNTSWFTAVGDAANRGTSPFLELTLPGDATVSEIRMFGNRSFAAGFDFFAGTFEVFAADVSRSISSLRVVALLSALSVGKKDPTVVGIHVPTTSKRPNCCCASYA